jgi:WD40 repeat protein
VDFLIDFYLTNQKLKGEISMLEWNEPLCKLTSVDKSGQLYTWSARENDNEWIDEMNSIRKDNSIKCLKWSPNGAYMAILYDDSQLMMLSLEGKKIWNKQLSSKELKLTCLVVCEYLLCDFFIE